MSINVAPRFQHFAASTTSSKISNGDAILVYGIVVAGAGSGAGNVTIADGDGTTLMDIRAGSNATRSFPTPWIADNGIQVTTPSTHTCTVFFGSPGS